MELRVTASKRFATFDLAVDFTVSAERVGVFGPSGSGKSTLVKMVAGLQQPDEGVIRLGDEILFDRQTNVAPERRRIGVIFQHPYLFPHLSVRQNLLYGQRRLESTACRVDFRRLVAVLRLDQLLERGVGNLSGGEQQRVAIGRAVLSNPRLLLMDEPLSALDDTLRFQIIDHLKAVSSEFGIPYLFISHSLLEMRLMCTEVLSMAAGRLQSRTTAEELARQQLGATAGGYTNLLTLGRPEPAAGLFSYPWGGLRLLLSYPSERESAVVELSSKDIMLFKKHPEAISARNLLPCTVRTLFASGRKVGLELDCAGNTLIAEVVQEAVDELAIAVGSPVYAAIKASAFRMLPG